VAHGVRSTLVDARGLVVTPGWVDLHTHVYWGEAPLGVDADAHCPRRGLCVLPSTSNSRSPCRTCQSKNAADRNSGMIRAW
jgi:hypothetical protein